MKSLKTTLKYGLISFVTMFILLFLVSTLYYFDIISSNVVGYFRLGIILIVLFVTSYILGKNTEKNGYLEGMKFGLFNILLFLLISVVFFRNDFQLRIILYDVILLVTSVLGSMIGINKSSRN